MILRSQTNKSVQPAIENNSQENPQDLENSLNQDQQASDKESQDNLNFELSGDSSSIQEVSTLDNSEVRNPEGNKPTSSAHQPNSYKSLLKKSIQDTARLIDLLNESLFSTMPLNHEFTYNKDMAELMSKNIPKFELNSKINPALELRSFLKSCENVLKLFPDQEQHRKEFFNLIKFRLGYDVQERITKDKFDKKTTYDPFVT